MYRCYRLSIELTWCAQCWQVRLGVASGPGYLPVIGARPPRGYNLKFL